MHLSKHYEGSKSSLNVRLFFHYSRERDSPPATLCSHAGDVAHRRYAPVPGSYNLLKMLAQEHFLNANCPHGFESLPNFFIKEK